MLDTNLLVSAGTGSGMLGILAVSLLLGILHGITPDEHTWPITVSYAIGAGTGKQGMKAGLLFSAAFALQRAIASELAFLALAPILASGALNAWIDLLVGVVMAASGVYILRLGRELHLTEGFERFLHRVVHVGKDDGTDGMPADGNRPIPVRMTLVHGFVAGWGTGAFAIIIYTVLAPAMPNAAVAFLPGLLFGIGTMLVQGLAGLSLGAWMRSRNLGADAMNYVSRSVAGNTLFYGGLLFAAWGLVSILLPSIADRLDAGLPTGLRIPNLDSINAGLVLVAVIVAVIAGGSFVRAIRRVQTLAPAQVDAR